MKIDEYNKFLEEYKLFLKDKEQNPVNLQRKELQNTGLSETVLSLILGGILGDGSLKIHNNYKNARYSFRHSIVQKEYFDWKVNQLLSICANKYLYLQEPDGYSKNKKLRFCSAAREDLTKILKKTHIGNQVNVQRAWLNHLTPLSLAIWWCDDGSIISRNRQGCLSTDGFPLEAQDIIVQYFEKTWAITFKPSTVTSRTNKSGSFYTKTFTRLYINQNSLKKLLTIIMPYIPCREMVYKCALRYNDQQFQERWISHMEERLPLHLKSKARELFEKPLGSPFKKILPDDVLV